MVSKTRLEELVKGFDWQGVEAALAESPELLGVRDERGRTWLHVACKTPPKSADEVEASIRTADVLIAAGLDISDAAFIEGSWRATPLWCAIGRGNNLALAKHLLELGCDPEHCLFAAQFGRKPEAIRLLVAHGAKVDARFDDGGTPFTEAIAWSHFEEAELLLELGADVNARNGKGLTALHLMLKKGSEPKWLEMVVRHGARGDIPEPDGRTAIEILKRKRDPVYRALAEKLSSSTAKP